MKEIKPDIAPKTVVHTPDIQPTIDEEYCVCPEAHLELERQMDAITPNPLLKFIVMSEVLGPPKCQRR